MKKKAVYAVTLFVTLLILLPLFISMFFTQQTSAGKIIVEKVIDAPYLNHTRKEYTLVYFGYVGCTKVCTPLLYNLSALYNSKDFASLKPHVGVAFVNLLPEISPDQPQQFAESFSPEFEGIYLDQKRLMTIDRDFSLFFSKSLSNPGEIDHSDHLYLIRRQKNGDIVLINIYTTHPLNKRLIVSDINRLIKGTQ